MQILPLTDYKANPAQLYYVSCLMEEELPLTQITKTPVEILNDAVSCSIMVRHLYGTDGHRMIQTISDIATTRVHAAVYAAFTQAENAQNRMQIFPKLKMRSDYLPLTFSDQEASDFQGTRMAMIMNHRGKDYPKFAFGTSAAANLVAYKTDDDFWCFAEYDLGAPASINSLGIVSHAASNIAASPFHASRLTVVEAYVGTAWVEVTGALVGTLNTPETINAVNVVAQKFRVISKLVDTNKKVMASMFGIKFYGTYSGAEPRVLTKPKHMVLASAQRTATAFASTSYVPFLNESNSVATRDRLWSLYGFTITDDITQTPTTDVFVPELGYKAGQETIIPHFNIISSIITGEGV